MDSHRVCGICDLLLDELSKELICDQSVQAICSALVTASKEFELKNSERELVYIVSHTLLSDYALLHEGNTCDYGAMRVYVKLLKNCILDGMQDKSIDSIVVNVLYTEGLRDYEITYSNVTRSNPQTTDIIIEWNALHEVYKSYSLFKAKYLSFDEHSIRALATIRENYERYKTLGKEKEIYSCNGIGSDLAAVIEFELKKVIRKAMRWSPEKKISFEKAITSLEKYDSQSNPWIFELQRYTDELTWVRKKIHNELDHGARLLSQAELEKLLKLAFFSDLLQIISNVFIYFQ